MLLPGEEVLRTEERQLLAACAQHLGTWAHSAENRILMHTQQQAFDQSRAPQCVIDMHARYVNANRAYARLYGRSASALAGEAVREIVGEKVFREEVQPRLERARAGETLSFRAERHDGAGALHLIDFTYAPVVIGSEVAAVVASGHDVTELVEARRRLEELALHDPLTGLPNRRLFDSLVGLALDRARRDRTTLAILFLDLDHFKEVNDHFGHASGDALLGVVAGRIEELLRSSDVVARLGGDEFAIVLSQVDGERGAAEAAEKLIASIRTPVPLEGGEGRVQASIGIALFPEDGDEASTLLRRADAAMYQAKQTGRGRWCRAVPAGPAPEGLP